jgi:hypothetical protein
MAMKQATLIALTVICLAGCGDQGAGPDSWQESMPLSAISTNHLRRSAHTVLTATVTNLTGGAVATARIYVRAYTTGDVLLDKTVKTITDLPAGASSTFQVYIDDGWLAITRWEYWVEWQSQ